MRRLNIAVKRVGLIAIFFLSLPLVTGRIYASDEVEGFSWLHSLFFDRDVSFENEYQYFYNSGQVKNPSFHETFLEDRRTDTGARPNFTTLGAAVLWTPFYFAGHVAAYARGARTDGLSQPYITAVAVGSAVYGFLALMLSAAIARRIVGDGAAALVAVWFGTPLLFYMYVTPIFTHACSAFAVALFLWIWLRVRDRWSPIGAFALGASAALMTMVRAQDALFAAGPALDFCAFCWQSRRGARQVKAQPPASAMTTAVSRLARVGFVGIAGFLLAYTPQLFAFKALNGRFRQSDYETRKMTWTSPHGLQVLFDAQHGLIAWTPLALVALTGLILLALDGQVSSRGLSKRRFGVLCLIMFGLQAYIAGSVESWTVAGAFGQRRFVSVTALLVIGISAVLARARQARAARLIVAALLLACVWWNLGLMAQFGLHTMDRERLALANNARQTFVTLPRALPSLAWRYLTDRHSFYNQPRQ